MFTRLCCILAVLLAIPAAALASSQVVTRTVDLSPGDLRVEHADGYAFLELRGGTNSMPGGAPDLPLYPVHVRLPEGTEVASVRVVPLSETVIPGSYRLGAVAPRQPGAWTGPVAVDPAILRSPAWYPADPLLHADTGRMRGTELAAVAVAPVAWRPTTGEVRLLTRFRVEVTVRPEAPAGGDLVIRRESPVSARSFRGAVDGLVGGGPAGMMGAAGTLAPQINSGEPFAPTFRPSLDGSPVDMVIITSSDQAAEYQLLADFRTKIGVSTVVRTVDWIKANYTNGVDTPETIRNFIRDAVSKWGTAWVLLGGDTDVIPIRFGYTTAYGTEEIPTDLYYSNLDGNWNADGDAVFGEAWAGSGNTGDNADLYPDVWVGRLTSTDATTAGEMVAKTLSYQQSPPLGYQNRMVFASEVLFPDNWTPGMSIQYDGAVVSEDAIDSLQVQNGPVRLYENYTAWPGAVAEYKQTVIDSVNAGCGIFHHVGHGYINTMSVGLLHETLINSDADALTNGDKTFLLYAVNCTSAAVDFNCIAERFLGDANGGAVSVVGSTRLDFPNTGRYYQNEFYGLVFQRGVTELGKAQAMAKVPYVPFSTQDNTNRWTQFTLIYLGDPDLDLWTDVPGTLSVSHNGTFTLGQGTYTVSVLRDGSPVDSARVALFKDGDAYAVGYTDGSGQAALPFRPDETGSFSVGVYAKGALPYLDTGTVTAPGAAPYVFALGQGITDDGSGSTVGNGDGNLDAGETADLNVSLKNNGSVGETGITATLSTADPYVTVVDNFALYPDLGAGASAAATDPFQVSLDPATPDRHLAHCTLNVFGVQGTYSQEIILYLHAPILQLTHQAVRDTVGNGNGNGTVAVNEDFAIIPTLRNVGLGTAYAVQARLRSTDPAVTITDSVSVLGDIPEGQSAVNPADGFALRLSDVSTAHELTLVAVDAYGEIFTRSLDIAAPATPLDLVSYGEASSVGLTWTPVADADLMGYAVYRAPASSGPYTRLNTGTGERISYFDDDGLPSLTRYYYKVAAVDSSGNEGPASVVASATTTLPLHAGFPIEIGSASTSGITLADLDHDGIPEILGGGQEIYAVRSNGEDFYNGDEDVRTLGPITDTNGQLFWNTPAVGDVDLDGSEEIAGVTWNDSKVWLVDDTGSPLPGWPKSTNIQSLVDANPLGSVCLADVDADGTLEILCSVGRLLFCWHYDGTELRDGDNNPSTDGVLLASADKYSYSTPTVANIDGDPYPEIIAAMYDGKLYVLKHDGTPYPGFPFACGANITSSPAVADIDNDGRMEIVFGASDNLLYAIRSDLSQPSGFPVGIQLADTYDSSPAVGDVTGDGIPDVAIGASNGAVFLFRGQNASVPTGWPVQIRDNQGNKVSVRSSPVLADVDGDGSVDVVVGDQTGRIHAFNAAGQALPGFPIQTGNLVENAPAVWDVDNDGLVEILAESFDQKLYCWDTPWTFDAAKAPWPMFKRNQRNSGWTGSPVFQVTGVGDTPPAPEPVLRQNVPNPFRAGTVIRYRVPEGESFRGVRLRIFDMNGRLVRTLVEGEQPPGLYDRSWDGRDEGGRPVAAGIYPYRLDVAGKTATRKMVLLK